MAGRQAMNRRAFLQAVASGCVAAVAGVVPRQLGDVWTVDRAYLNNGEVRSVTWTMSIGDADGKVWHFSGDETDAPVITINETDDETVRLSGFRLDEPV